MPTARWRYGAAAVGSKIFNMGGSVPFGSTYDVNEVYDVATDTRSTGVSLTSERYLSVAAAVVGRLFIFTGFSPQFGHLTLVEELQPSFSICDVDKDGDIDKLDLAAISKSRDQIALPGDPRDANRDGKIDPADVKICIPKCTLANCAVPVSP